MKRSGTQYKLFDQGAQLPEGLLYRPDFVTPEEEELLLAFIESVDLHKNRRPREAEGGFAKRRSKGFGWGWDSHYERFVPGPPLPRFLGRFARKIAKWLDIPKDRVVEALINEYSPGAGVGFHRDNEGFEHIIGISLAGWCTMRFRPFDKRAKALSLELEPRSAYVMHKNIRWGYMHSVAATRTLRYSITFRTLPKSVRIPR